MAYREFYEAPVPEATNPLEQTTQAISNLFQSVGKANQAKKKAADQFAYDLNEGKYENDQKILNEFSNNVLNRGKQEILKQGRTSNETDNMKHTGKSYQQMSQIQFEKAKALHQEVFSRETKDQFYNSQVDLDKLKVAVNGEDNEVNFYTRGDRLAEFEKKIGQVSADPAESTFKNVDYRQSYVKGLGDQYKQKEFGNANVKNSRYDESVFWDDATGKPGVTDQHAVDYIKSDARVDELFTDTLNRQIDKEIDKMIASGDPRTAWMKGGNAANLTGAGEKLSKADIRAQLIDDPSKNIINSQDYGIRKRTLAKEDLNKANRINSKVSVEYKEKKEANGLYKNENIVHSYAFNNPVMQAAIPGQTFNPNSNPAPGGVLLQKNGKPIVFNSTNPIRTNANTGLTNKNRIGSDPFNLTGYQLQAFKSTGAPYMLQGSDTESLVNFVNNIPLDHFDPNGKYKLLPEMKIGLQGFTVNPANIQHAANMQERTILTQMAKAQSDGDMEKVTNLQNNLNEIKNVRALVGMNVDQTELALAASRAGIQDVQVNEIVQASDTDLANIRAITQGFDLKNPAYQSDDMRRVADAYRNRAQQAISAGYTSTPATAPATAPKAKTTKTKSKPEMVKVVAPDGRTGSIPSSNLDAAMKAGYKKAE